jgi:hypothetical protein
LREKCKRGPKEFCVKKSWPQSKFCGSKYLVPLYLF